MRDQTTRILLMLAGSQFDENDLYKFFKQVERHGAMRTTDTIADLRASVGLNNHRLETVKELRSSRTKVSRQKSLAADIEAMLVGSAGLQKKDAIQILLAELRRRFGDDWDWPSTNKVAFDLWISRLTDQVEPSELLHIATQVRNDLVHGRKSVSDWPLKNG